MNNHYIFCSTVAWQKKLQQFFTCLTEAFTGLHDRLGLKPTRVWLVEASEARLLLAGPSGQALMLACLYWPARAKRSQAKPSPSLSMRVRWREYESEIQAATEKHAMGYLSCTSEIICTCVASSDRSSLHCAWKVPKRILETSNRNLKRAPCGSESWWKSIISWNELLELSISTFPTPVFSAC